MTKEQLEKANELGQKISNLFRSMIILERACNECFAERDSYINILGTSQEEGEALIPASVQKIVCKIALLELREQYRITEKELENI